MSTAGHETSTPHELSGTLTPSTESSHSHKLPETDFEKGLPVGNEKAETVCLED